MVYGSRFTEYLPRYMSRARAVGAALVVFCLDDGAFDTCVAEGGLCARGWEKTILHKFTLPLVLLHLGHEVVWLDFDVFLFKNPTPHILAHAESVDPPYEVLVSGSYEADCICNGIVYLRPTEAVVTWWLAALVWMYEHPYEHDQKTVAAWLQWRETVTGRWQEQPGVPIPRWDILDPVNAVVTPAVLEGNGWSGSLDEIVIYHFLNGESDFGSRIDLGKDWMNKYSINVSDVASRDLLDIFYNQSTPELYSTPTPPHTNEQLRAVVLSSRKDGRRTDLFGKQCGPMTLQNAAEGFVA